jgi:hypothetical protein
MIVEEVFEKQNTPTHQRRPNGHVKQASTKKGNKKRSLRAQVAGLIGEEDGSEDGEEEEDCPLCDGRPPVIIVVA